MTDDILPLRRADRLTAQQKLALAVIAQAFTDAADPRVTPAVRSEARRFISGSTMLNDWCDVANIDRAYVKDMTARFLRGTFDVVSDGPVRFIARPKASSRRVARPAVSEQKAVGAVGAVVALRVSPQA
jgi:hypothetical protein